MAAPIFQSDDIDQSRRKADTIHAIYRVSKEGIVKFVRINRKVLESVSIISFKFYELMGNDHAKLHATN